MQKPSASLLHTLFTLPYQKVDKINKFPKDLNSNDKFHQFVRSFESLTRSKQFINEMFGETRQEAWAADFLYEQSHNYCCRKSLFIVTYYSDY